MSSLFCNTTPGPCKRYDTGTRGPQNMAIPCVSAPSSNTLSGNPGCLATLITQCCDKQNSLQNGVSHGGSLPLTDNAVCLTIALAYPLGVAQAFPRFCSGRECRTGVAGHPSARLHLQASAHQACARRLVQHICGCQHAVGNQAIVTGPQQSSGGEIVNVCRQSVLRSSHPSGHRIPGGPFLCHG